MGMQAAMMTIFCSTLGNWLVSASGENELSLQAPENERYRVIYCLNVSLGRERLWELTRILCVGEKPKICPFNYSNNSGQHSHAHHNNEPNLRSARHLQFPECTSWYNCQNNIGERCVCTEPVREVIQHVRTPARSGKRLFPQLLSGLALCECKSDGYDCEYDLEDRHPIEGNCTTWIRI
jgi:hypothetical protein